MLATGRPLMLSVREFELLVAMARRLGAIITREELYRTVWGGELRPGDRSVDVYVSKLRSKLEDGAPRPPLHPHASWLRIQISAPAFTKCSHRGPQAVEETVSWHAGFERDGAMRVCAVKRPIQPEETL